MNQSGLDLCADESELICRHGDPVFGRSVEGIDLVTCLYASQEVGRHRDRT